MDLYSWFLSSSSSSEPVTPIQIVASSPSSSREPIDFLKPHQTPPPQPAPAGGTPDSDTGPVVTTESFPLTPLESQLKNIVLSVYSDRLKPLKSESSPRHTKEVPSDQITFETRAVSSHSGTLGLHDLSTGVSPRQSANSLADTTVRLNPSIPQLEAVLQWPVSITVPAVSEKYLYDTSTPNSDEFHNILNSDPPKVTSSSDSPSKPHGVYRVLSSSLGPKQVVCSSSPDNHYQEQAMSDARSVTSTDELSEISSSAPIFSADDQNIELLDPDFPPSSHQLGSLPYSATDSQSYLHRNQLGADGAAVGNGSGPLSLDILNSGSSLFYSFTDPPGSTRSQAAGGRGPGSSKDPKTGIISSFGIPPHLLQPRLAKTRQPHTVARDGDGGEGGASETDGPQSNCDSSAIDHTHPSGGPDQDTPDLSDPLPTVGAAKSPLPDVDARPDSKDATPTPESTQDTPTPESSQEFSHDTHEEASATSDSGVVKPAQPTSLPKDPALLNLGLPPPPPLEPGSLEGSNNGQIPVVTSLDSDIETASVVSVQQLTETYLHDPLNPLPDSTTPLSEGGRIPFPVPSSNPPPPKQALHSPGVSRDHTSPLRPTRELPRVQEKLSQHVAELPSPGMLPAHINPSGSLGKKEPVISPVFPPHSKEPQLAANSLPSFTDDCDSAESVKLLEEMLAEEKRASTFLEGQLEAVKEECEAALRERPALLSRVSKAEAQLAEMAAALERERSKAPASLNAGPDSSTSDREAAGKDLQDAREALEREKRAAVELRGRLSEEEQKSRQLGRELEDARQTLSEQESGMAELEDRLQKSRAEASKKADEVQEMACKLSSLEAGHSALEESKSWLHDQLQDAQRAKLELQAELRDSKAAGIARDIKCDQLQQENTALQGQIGDLLKGVLQDKAKMVDQLETIKEDMVSNEDLYTELVAEKAQLEDIIRRKDDAIARLSSDTASAQMEREELGQKLDAVSSERDRLSREAGDLQRANKSLMSKLAAALRDSEEKDSDLKEMEKVKNSLQNRLRQTDVDVAGKEGTIQSLKEANDLLKHELALVSEAKEGADQENAEIKSEVASLESQLKSALDKCKEKDLLLTSQHSADEEKQMLQSLLAEKNQEVEQKDEAIKALESQTNELLGEFSTLRENFQSMASESGSVSSNLNEKDRVISHLAAEKDRLEGELSELRSEAGGLREQLEALQHERAHLLGAVEGSVEQEEYRKALQDKAQLQDQLNTLRVEQKRDEVKALSKIGRLEGELKAAQKSASRAEKDLEALKGERSEEASRSEEARKRAEAELKEAREKLRRATEDKQKAESKLGSPRAPSSSEQQLQGLLKAKCEQLKRQSEELAEQLQQATQQKAEVERASSLVASQLKQNAEREKRELAGRNRELSLELERLRGRLAGMHTTQATIRDHATSLELSLARKESSIVQLTAESQKLQEDKNRERRGFEAETAALQKKLGDVDAAAAQERERASSEKQRADELERELRQLQSASEQAELSKKDSTTMAAAKDKERLATVLLEKDALQSDVSYLKSQLLIAKTAAQSAKRQVTDKQSQVEILERELGIARSRSEEAEEEVRKLREHLRTSDGSRKHQSKAGEAEGRRSWDRESSVSSKGRDRQADTSLSAASGIEEVDLSGLQGAAVEGGASDAEKVARLNETLRELGSRVVQARQQGEEAAELKKSGEISVLQKELGSKSRTLNSLQSYLLSLKQDMSKLHQQMDHHSAAMKESFKSSRLIESQIEDLRRNSSLPSPLMLSTPTEQSQ